MLFKKIKMLKFIKYFSQWQSSALHSLARGSLLVLATFLATKGLTEPVEILTIGQKENQYPSSSPALPEPVPTNSSFADVCKRCGKSNLSGSHTLLP